MAKSTRSKVKRHFRAKKREQGVYAATEAARLHRLSMKLKTLVAGEDDGGDEEMPEGEGGAVNAEAEGMDEGTGGQEPSTTDNAAAGADAMDLDPSSSSKKISTHGPRNSGREQWRTSKGLPARPKAKSMNRQGGVAARRKAGRSHRRR